MIAGMVAGVPGHGGASWAVLQWVLGLRALGHQVVLLEPVDALTPERTAAFAAIASAFGIGDAAALVTPERDTAGMTYADVLATCRRADVLLNLAGMLHEPELTAPIVRRVYVDLDPVFTQLWHHHGSDVGLEGHTAHVTVGTALTEPGDTLPGDGYRWIATLPPVHLPAWPFATLACRYGLTTVANWRSYGTIDHRGVRYGQKAHSWRDLVRVGERSVLPCEPALAIHPDERDDIQALKRAGWRLQDPALVASTPASYRDFVQSSAAELGIAKSGYVVSGSGWFSDRSACYLASGRPVVAQETGFSRCVPTGTGLLAFRDADEAVDAIGRIAADYPRHRRAARALAEEHLRADVVLRRLLDAVMTGTPGLAIAHPPPAERKTPL